MNLAAIPREIVELPARAALGIGYIEGFPVILAHGAAAEQFPARGSSGGMNTVFFTRQPKRQGAPRHFSYGTILMGCAGMGCVGQFEQWRGDVLDGRENMGDLPGPGASRCANEGGDADSTLGGEAFDQPRWR